MIVGKIWGGTSPLLVTPLIEIHQIFIKPFSSCSLHAHTRKWNAFYVIDGMLEIHVHKNDYDLVDVTTLYENDITTVPPGEYHQFVTKEQGVSALEIYYLEALGEDIIRKTVGSRNEKEN